MTMPAATESLNILLADLHTLALKTQNFHWNVTGPAFYALHELFGKQYEEAAELTDVLAEQIRASGAEAQAGLETFLALRRLSDAAPGPKSADAMTAELAADHVLMRGYTEALVESGAFPPFIEDALTVQMNFHAKAAWMLNASAAA